MSKKLKWLILFGFNIGLCACMGLINYQAIQSGKANNQKLDHLDAEGQTVAGEVANVQIFHRPRGRITIELSYTYRVAGVPYRVLTTAHTTYAKKLKEGSVIDVRYLPDDPTTSEIVGNEDRLDANRTALCVGGVLMGGVLMLVAFAVIEFYIKPRL